MVVAAALWSWSLTCTQRVISSSPSTIEDPPPVRKICHGSESSFCYGVMIWREASNSAELAERWTELPQVSDESRSFFRVHTGYFSNIPKCIKAEFIASWACSQSSVASSSQR
ncbi:hypothetical protein TNCV_1218531 [Trichonephila clavipes]|nr:hypothetical protein TNCV_1218531 [Trichonephila clavipes]